MGKNTLGFQEITDQTGIAMQTLRRYAKDFARWLPTRKAGRQVRFQPEAIEVIESIRSLFEQGLTTGQVREQLAASVSATIDVGTILDEPAIPAAVDAPTVAALVPLLDRFVTALERGVAALEAIAKNSALQASDAGGWGKGHPKAETPLYSDFRAPLLDKSRSEIVAEVMRLRQTGLGASATASAMRRAGWPTLSGRGQWASGSVRRILKGVEK